MKANLLRASCVFWGFLCLLASGQGILGNDSVHAEIADVTASGDAPLRISVWFNSSSGVAGSTHDDSDLWITNSDGFHSGVTFVEWSTWISRPDLEGDFRENHVAIYELQSPRGGWTEELNGEYAVMLAGDEVEKRDGSYFDLALVGSFKVAIGAENGTVKPLSGEIAVETFATPGAPEGNVSELGIATASVSYPYPVEVNWGEVKLNEDGSFCVEVEGFDLGGFVPQVLTTYTHRFELGMLDPGEYSVALKGGDAELARSKFQVGSGSGHLIKGLPSNVEIELERLPTRGLYPVFAANIRLTFGQYVARVEWSEASRRGDLSTSSFTAWIDPRVRIFAPMVVEHQVALGMFVPGEYTYLLSSLEEVVGRIPIIVRDPSGDFRPPEVTVRGAKVTTPGEEALEFSAEFTDEGELVVEGIEAQVLTAVNRMGEVFEIERTSLNFTADFTAGAIATYRMAAPGGSWDASDSGRYRLLLSEPELVCDRFGNHLRDPLIGYLTVEIETVDPEPVHTTGLTIVNDELVGRWTASVQLFVPEDLAVRDDWEVDWGEIRSAGTSFYFQPRFVRAGSNEPIGFIPPSDTTGAGTWLAHDYDLGPISGGRWLVCVRSNLGHFAKARLIAGSPDDENLEGTPFDFWRAWADREPSETESRRFWEYCVGSDPTDPSDDHLGDPKPEVVDGGDGKRHLGLRCRMAIEAVDARFRFEGSTDMNTWIQLNSSQIKEVERLVRQDGIEEFMVCLVEDLETSGIRYLRVVAERW